MKKYVLSYKDFLKTLNPLKISKLQEDYDYLDYDYDYLDYDYYSKIQVVKEVKKTHNKIFGDQERIYLPFDPSLFNLEFQDKSELQETIEELLVSKGYEIISYTQNQCVKTGQKNITKIGKVLVSRDINRKDLADGYALEVDSLRNVKNANNLLVVFSRNYHDIITMSTDKSWTSCQNLEDGSHREYVAKDLEQGSIIAYLIKSTDKEISNPEARILIKPFINTTNSKDVVLLPCTKTYHRGTNQGTPLAYPKFPEFVMSWVKQVQPDINGTYKMQKDVYPDGDTTLKIKKSIKLSKEEIGRALNNPKTFEDLKISFAYYNVNFNLELNISKVKMGIDGLWIYNDALWFYCKELTEFPKCFKYLKEIKGGLITKFISIENFKGLENLKTIRGGLVCYGTPLKSFEGLENLQSIGGDLECQSTNIKDFKGLENLKTIGRDFNCSWTPIKDFKGLENLKTIGRYFNFYNTKLESFNGLSKDIKIGDSIYSEELRTMFNKYKNS